MEPLGSSAFVPNVAHRRVGVAAHSHDRGAREVRVCQHLDRDVGVFGGALQQLHGLLLQFARLAETEVIETSVFCFVKCLSCLSVHNVMDSLRQNNPSQVLGTSQKKIADSHWNR